MGARKKLILDVDTGTDDAVALLFAALHPDLELIAATTVNGNNPVANCTDNTLRVFDLLGVPIPVYEGAATPLTREDFPVPRAILHAKGSMHGRDLPGRDRADRARAGRAADEHRHGHPPGAADRGADPADRDHGRGP